MDKNSKGIVSLLVIIALALVVVIGIGYLVVKNKFLIFPNTSTPKMCTQDAMQCPDGSYVGRSGPNCEFAQCPPFTTSTSSPGEPINWKTYTNTKSDGEIYRLVEIQLPSDWVNTGTDKTFTTFIEVASSKHPFFEASLTILYENEIITNIDAQGNFFEETRMQEFNREINTTKGYSKKLIPLANTFGLTKEYNQCGEMGGHCIHTAIYIPPYYYDIDVSELKL